MKTQFRVAPHSTLPGQLELELWHDGQLIGTVTGADGPGVRVPSKYPVTVVAPLDMVTEIQINPKGVIAS